MGIPGDFVRQTAGLVKPMGGVVAELEAMLGPFRLFALITRSAHVPELGKWSLYASAGWMDDDRSKASVSLWDYIKERVGPDAIRHLAWVDVKLESESPVIQIQRKLGWVIREGGLVGDIAIEAPAWWVVYRCLPNGEDFPETTRPEGEPIGPVRSHDLHNQVDASIVPIEVTEKIIGMARAPGWYGEGSGAISQEACWASIDFVSRARKEFEGLEFPRIGPSPSGAVALQWDFDDRSFVVRISSGNSSSIHYQETGPDFHQEAGIAARDHVLSRLGAFAGRHVLG